MKRYSKYDLADLKRTLKPVDSWWTVCVVDPLAIRLTLWFSNRTAVSPHVLTAVAITLSIGSGYLFSRRCFALAAIVYETAFLFDCIDGKLALLKQVNTDVGRWLDSVSDKVRLIANVLGLTIAVPELSKLAIVFVGLYLWDETESTLFSQMLRRRRGGSTLSARAGGYPLLIRIRNYLKDKRISGPLSLVEQDTVAFVVMPLLGMPILGIKLGIIMNFVGRLISVCHFWFWRYRRPSH